MSKENRGDTRVACWQTDTAPRKEVEMGNNLHWVAVPRNEEPKQQSAPVNILLGSLVVGFGGYALGKVHGYNDGHQKGYATGYQGGHHQGYQSGYQKGYVDGRQPLLQELQTRDEQIASLRSENANLKEIAANQSKALAKVPIAWTMELPPYDEESDNGNGSHTN